MAVRLRQVIKSREIDQALILRRDDPIAIACPLLDESAIDDFHRAARFSNGAAALQSLQGRRYSRPADSEHHGQQIMREGNNIAVEPVMSQK